MKVDNEMLTLSFAGAESVDNNYSQAGQDIFVLCCLDGKRNGTFLDFGCNHPTVLNNTFLLENKFSWKGIGVDIDKSMIDLWEGQRVSSAFRKDCRKLNFDKIIGLADTTHFDYLSLDLEPASTTFECLDTIPFDKMEFSVITYEHDLWRFGTHWMKESRKIIEKNGYKRICTNIGDPCPNTKAPNPFEDWYYNPKYVSYERIKVLESCSKDWRRVLFKG